MEYHAAIKKHSIALDVLILKDDYDLLSEKKANYRRLFQL